MDINPLQMFLGAGLGVLIIAAFFLWHSWFRVEEGHAAVITSFGAALFSAEKMGQVQIFSPGIHRKKPWEKVIQFSTMERVLDLSGPESGRHAMAADGTVLRLDSKIRFYPLNEHFYSYLFELKNPMGHIREMFTCLLRNEIANFDSGASSAEDFVGSYSLIRRDRSRLNLEMESFCNTKIGQKYGVKFNGVDLIDILPPQELEVALNAIQNAKNESETIFARAEADSRQKIAAAEQGIEISRTRAEAIAIDIQTQSAVVRKLIELGQFNNYLHHRKTEVLGDSRLTFMQKEI